MFTTMTKGIILMNKTAGGLTKVFATFFISIVAVLVILDVLGAINTDTSKDFLLKAGAALIVLAIASFVISWLQGSRK
jgi:hypothetical protein